MAKDKNKSKAAADDNARPEDQDTGAVAEPSPPGFDDLLSTIRDQILQSEARHGDVLSNMQSRLGSLGHGVEDIRERIPEDLTGDLKRIESGLDSLTDRVDRMTAGDTASHAGEPVEDVIADDRHVGHEAVEPQPESSMEIEQAPSDATPPSDVETPAEPYAPAALRSATVSGPSDDLTPAAVEKPESSPAVDPFEMVDTSIAAEISTPWDADSAEALTKFYEAEDEPATPNFTEPEDASEDATEIMPARTPDPERTEIDDVEPAGWNQPDTIAAATDGGLVDRAWLDSKFSEIASRIEQTLSEFDPEITSQQLGAKIADFETRVGTALQDVATRDDLDGLKNIETHVTGMANQVAHTENQMQRLESIEGQLQDVIARFSESAGAHFAGGDGSSQAAFDANEVAEAAAARIADHLSATGAGDAGAAGLAEMRSLIEGFLEEHREGNEQTALMLDTIQQAMIRILDRLDVLEDAAGFIPEAAPGTGAANYPEAEGSVPQAPSADEMSATPEDWAEPRTPQPEIDDDVMLSNQGVLDQTREDEADVEIHRHSPSETPDEPPSDVATAEPPPAMQVAADAATSSEIPQAQPAPSGYASPDLLAGRADSGVSSSQAAPASREAIDNIRNSFIADAQQAKAKAAAKAGSNAPGKAIRQTVLAGTPGMETQGSKATEGMFGSRTRRLLVGALLAVIVINGALFLLPSGDDNKDVTPPPAATIEKDANGKASEKRESSGSDQSNLHRPTDGFSPAVEKAVVLDDLKAAVDDAEQRALGAADLPFGLTLQQTTAKAWTQPGTPLGQVTSASLTRDDIPSGAKVIAAPRTTKASGKIAMPPLTVGPTSLRLAAANGDASAQFEVATRLSEGKGIKQDFKQAATWYKRSAAQGFAQAQYRLGTLYERGLGMERDVNRAQVWYGRAAEQGNVRAMHNLAVLSAGQASGNPDYARAAQWFLKAAESGLADSQFNAGVLYENGLGVSKDLVQAYKWYALAARTGDNQSLERSQKLRSTLSIELLSQAETAVRSFKPVKVDPLVNNARLAGQEWKSRHNS